MRLATKNYLRLSENGYAIFISSIFLLSGAILAWNHEMWRDEIQAWLIARDCKTLIELTKVLKKLRRSSWFMALWSLSTQIHNIFTNYHATIPSNGRHNNNLFVLQVFTLYKALKNAILIWLLSLLRISSYLQELCYWYVTALQFLHTFQILEKKIPNYWFSPLVTSSY